VFIDDFKDIKSAACDETFVSDVAIIGRHVDFGDDVVVSVTNFSLNFALLSVAHLAGTGHSVKSVARYMSFAVSAFQ